MGNVNVESTVSKYLVARVGKTVIINEMAEETGLRDEQIRAVMRRIITKNKLNIDVVSKGHVWRVNSTDPKPVSIPQQASEPEPKHQRAGEVITANDRAQPREARNGWHLYKSVGRDRDGLEIIQTQEGELYRLMPL